MSVSSYVRTIIWMLRVRTCLSLTYSKGYISVRLGLGLGSGKNWVKMKKCQDSNSAFLLVSVRETTPTSQPCLLQVTFVLSLNGNVMSVVPHKCISTNLCTCGCAMNTSECVCV